MINPILPNPSADSAIIREFMLAHVTQDLKRRAGYVPQKIDESKVIHHKITLGIKKHGVQLRYYQTDLCGVCCAKHKRWISRYFFAKEAIFLRLHVQNKAIDNFDDWVCACGYSPILDKDF